MRRLGVLLATAFVSLGVLGSVLADEPPAKPFQVVAPKDLGIVVNAINDQGDVVGFEWAEDKEHPGVLEQRPFFARGKEMTYLPTLPGYTFTSPAAVSDTGVVAGRAGRPAPLGVRVPLRNQAFVWDAKAGIRGLGTLPDDWASFATGISRDGRRISGFSVGENRVHACIWERPSNDDAWKASPLPQTKPMLGTTVVPISPDGLRVAGVDGLAPCLWTRDPNGAWTREVIADDSTLIPRAVNNAGTVVGVRFVDQGLTHAVMWTRQSGYAVIQEPTNYVRSEALAVNNAGVVVGMIDGPFGSEVGPNAFALEAGRIRIITEGGPYFVTANALNDKGQVAGVLENDEDEK